MRAVRTRGVIYQHHLSLVIPHPHPSPRQPSTVRLCFLRLTVAAFAKILKGALVEPGSALPLLISLCVALDTVVLFPPQYMFFLQRVPRLTALLVFHCLPECHLSFATSLQSSSPRSVPESASLSRPLGGHLPFQP